MPETRSVPTALGTPLAEGSRVGAEKIQYGKPPLVLQTQSFGYVTLDKPEQLKQWEQDLRNFYGISVDASGLRGRACETCSCGCSDDCGMLE
jgi:hypothetical protein